MNEPNKNYSIIEMSYNCSNSITDKQSNSTTTSSNRPSKQLFILKGIIEGKKLQKKVVFNDEIEIIQIDSFKRFNKLNTAVAAPPRIKRNIICDCSIY